VTTSRTGLTSAASILPRHLSIRLCYLYLLKHRRGYHCEHLLNAFQITETCLSLCGSPTLPVTHTSTRCEAQYHAIRLLTTSSRGRCGSGASPLTCEQTHANPSLLHLRTASSTLLPAHQPPNMVWQETCHNRQLFSTTQSGCQSCC